MVSLLNVISVESSQAALQVYNLKDQGRGPVWKSADKAHKASSLNIVIYIFYLFTYLFICLFKV